MLTPLGLPLGRLLVCEQATGAPGSTGSGAAAAALWRTRHAHSKSDSSGFAAPGCVRGAASVRGLSALGIAATAGAAASCVFLARRRVEERLLSLVLPHVERFAGEDPAAAAAAARGAAASASRGEERLPHEWLSQCEQLPSLLAYASQVAVFAAASVAAVPSPLLPQEVATLWKQHHQFQLLERRADTDVATELPRAAVRRKGPGHGLSTTELQQRIGTVLQQPLLQVVHQCSRLSLAICAWGHFESLALQQLLQLAAVAVHALLPIASLWLQMQQQALRQAAASGGTHPPMLVQQQQQLSRARAAIEEATGDLGLVVSLLEAFCPQTLHGLLRESDMQQLLVDCDALLDAAAAARQHSGVLPQAARAAAHPQGGLDDACSFVEETKAADVREAPPEDDALDTTRGAETASAAHFLSAASAPEAQAAAESETADAETTQDDAMSSEEATARASNSRSGDWNSLEAEVVTALRVLLPEAEGPPAKTSEGESQRQAQQRPLLLAFIAPADTQGRRQGILLPKKLLQLLVLRRLGWEVRLVNLSDCRGKGPLELQQLLADILHAGENSSCLWDLHHKVQGGGTIESGGLPHSPSKM
ncbi:uncharacterized protein LOC34621099 [Cyclospora cayetanensis]|uniref:Uncharacterized protein LOC34621099 n=1 Tax=Cyclospora cayetanensis TaxID=88456 RepID=A0A6P6RV77_9EIME|nr:uncharacterized protein LOC34621099 [Cyclospora cayetanensis]